MKKGNMLDIGIATVKKSGKTNMFMKDTVQYWAYYLGFRELVSWLQDASLVEYLKIIDCIDYDNTPTLSRDDINYFLDEMNDSEARLAVEDEFPMEINEYREKKGFFTLKTLPLSFADFEKDNTPHTKLLCSLGDFVEDHPYNYVLPMGSTYIMQFQDFLYEIDGGKVIELTPDKWKKLNCRKLSSEHQRKSEFVEKQMRLAVLFT